MAQSAPKKDQLPETATVNPPGQHDEVSEAPDTFWGRFKRGRTYWWLDQYFGMDLRTLGITRILFGLVVCIDIVTRMGDIHPFFSDDGILPRQVLIEKFSNPFYVTPHMMSGHPTVLWFIFAFHFIVSFLMMIGYRTRLMTAVNWLFTVSLHSRIGIIIQAGDNLLGLMLLWGAFTPWGARFSVDAALKTNKWMPKRVLNFGTAALIAQMPIVYFFTGLLKSGAPWTKDFTAVYYAMAGEEFTTWVGYFTLDYLPLWVTQFFTVTTLIWEVAAPVLIFFPFVAFFQTREMKTSLLEWLRMIVVLSLLFMQFGFTAGLTLGLFPAISTSATVPAMPSLFWDKLDELWLRKKASLTGLKIYFDAQCAFCRKAVLVLREFFLPSWVPLLEAQTEPSVEQTMRSQNSWVVVDAEGNKLTRFAAFAHVVSLGPAWIALVVLMCGTLVSYQWEVTIPVWVISLALIGGALKTAPVMALGNAAYEFIAARRPQFGEATAGLVYAPVRWKSRYISQVVCAVFCVYCIADNFVSVKVYDMPASYRWVGRVFRLTQNWKMFAPRPPSTDGWWVIPAKLADGREVDLMTGLGAMNDKAGGPLTWAKPPRPVYDNNLEDYRWRKYFRNMANKSHKEHRNQYARYICRNWNRSHTGNDRLETFKIVYLQENMVPKKHAFDQPLSEVKEVVLWKHYCFKRPNGETVEPPKWPGASEQAAGSNAGAPTDATTGGPAVDSAKARDTAKPDEQLDSIEPGQEAHR
jgi:hypothetical protein